MNSSKSHTKHLRLGIVCALSLGLCGVAVVTHWSSVPAQASGTFESAAPIFGQTTTQETADGVTSETNGSKKKKKKRNVRTIGHGGSYKN